MNLGRSDTNKATGPTIAAIFALLKNTLIRKQKGISDMQKKKKYANTKALLDFGKKDIVVKKVAEMAIQKNNTKAVIDQARLLTHGKRPMISMSSFIFISFSSTAAFTILETG